MGVAVSGSLKLKMHLTGQPVYNIVRAIEWLHPQEIMNHVIAFETIEVASDHGNRSHAFC